MVSEERSGWPIFGFCWYCFFSRLGRGNPRCPPMVSMTLATSLGSVITPRARATRTLELGFSYREKVTLSSEATWLMVAWKAMESSWRATTYLRMPLASSHAVTVDSASGPGEIGRAPCREIV